MPPDDFYQFLKDKYFVWKFTDKRYLNWNLTHLEKHKTDVNKSDLKTIQSDLFTFDRTDICEGLKIATRICGLGIAGGSGLLSILFPEDFGTVDQFVVISLRSVSDMAEHENLVEMKEESLSLRDGELLIKIMREKAKELNERFTTDYWTPRKTDRVLWSFGRERKTSHTSSSNCEKNKLESE